MALAAGHSPATAVHQGSGRRAALELLLLSAVLWGTTSLVGAQVVAPPAADAACDQTKVPQLLTDISTACTGYANGQQCSLPCELAMAPAISSATARTPSRPSSATGSRRRWHGSGRRAWAPTPPPTWRRRSQSRRTAVAARLLRCLRAVGIGAPRMLSMRCSRPLWQATAQSARWPPLLARRRRCHRPRRRARTTRPGLTSWSPGAHAPALPRTVSTTAPGERTQLGSRQRSPAPSHAREAAPSPTTIAVSCQRISYLRAGSYISLILLSVLSHVFSFLSVSSYIPLIFSHQVVLFLTLLPRFSHSVTFVWFLAHSSHVSRISLSDLSSRLGSHTDNRGSFAP